MNKGKLLAYLIQLKQISERLLELTEKALDALEEADG